MRKIMMFLSFVLIGLLVVSSTSNPLQAAIPAEERAALIALYNSTNGDSWGDNSGWKGNNNELDGFSQIGSEGTWYGITISDDHVTAIWLDENNLNGSIPPELGNLSNLGGLCLSYNQLSGSIPPELGNLSKLRYFDMCCNSLSGSIPPEVGNLGNLRGLNLAENQLSGIIPPELGNLSNLECLYMYSNQLSGSIPLELGNLSNLRSLDLDDNQLIGSIPLEIGNLSSLTDLWLYNNQLSGIIPPELGNLGNLEQLYLCFNQLSGIIPPELGNLNNLVDLDLGSNDLVGSIPLELGNLSNLKYLWLSNNQLSGRIPPELGNLSNLLEFSLDDNRLSGTIPSELGNLSNLESLNLSSNQLSGNIPAELGNLISLGWLHLNSNNLSGSIPTSLTNLTNLWWIDISYNCLYTNDPDLKAWLSGFDTDLESYQCKDENDPPIGSFDTPIDGSTVCSSIPVTGWTLDDTGIDSVKIYRQQGNGQVYIGDATFVEGARQDIAALYPGYPNNTKAGWGYMMLTNFLPNGGNGTFVIHAIATDVVGKTTTLGTKTIICDNANAIKPFGAIDTPTQGGTASSSIFTNWGWVLTPQPNSIPIDGSTIRVFVDSVEIGHPTYNIYREDIATLFPGYANSSGAIGYFSLDTTAYENGVHTIFWTAEDNAGNTDGIGSRYFSIQNSQRAGSTAHGVSSHDPGAVPNVLNIPIDYSLPVRVKKGFNRNVKPIEKYPDENGNISIELKELQFLEIHFFDSTLNVEPRTLNLYKTPIGSTLDAPKGIFYWQPGPGFIRDYQLVFIVKEPGGDMIRKNILVTIIPKFTIER